MFTLTSSAQPLTIVEQAEIAQQFQSRPHQCLSARARIMREAAQALTDHDKIERAHSELSAIRWARNEAYAAEQRERHNA